MAATTNPVPFTLQGKSALVTGAGSGKSNAPYLIHSRHTSSKSTPNQPPGINLAFATLLLTHGCNVLIADLTLRPEARQLLSQYQTGTPRALFQPTDVTSWPQLRAAFAVAIREFASLDIVCPGAGVFEPHWSNFWHPPGSTEPSASSTDDPEGGGYAVLDINLVHPIRMTQLALSHFLSCDAPASPRNPKRIVHVSSIASETASVVTPLYHASKWGLTGFVRSLGALEEEVGVRVNCVAPGVIRTPLWTEHPEKMHMVDEGRDVWASAEEVAEAMVRCVTEEGLGGGTVLEVGRGQSRVVPLWGNLGPRGNGHTVSGVEKARREVFGWLGRPGWGIVGGQDEGMEKEKEKDRSSL